MRSFFLNRVIFFYVSKCFVHMYVCAIFACLVPTEVKRDGIETNYWMVMSHRVGLGNEPVSSARRTNALNG